MYVCIDIYMTSVVLKMQALQPCSFPERLTSREIWCLHVPQQAESKPKEKQTNWQAWSILWDMRLHIGIVLWPD